MNSNIETTAAAGEHMNIVIVGHVDHGKSTVIGRLLADTQALPDGKLEQIQEMCRRNAKPFEYAFLLDALKDERSQGITIDAARCFFHTEKRQYIIIDAPGHIEFLKNMITGASRAEAALLVIDAREGICENSRRHGYMLEMLGIKQVAVLINKMDLVGYDEATFRQIKRDYGAFLEKIKLRPTAFIPVSAMKGDNIAVPSTQMPWYTGATVLEELDTFVNIDTDEKLPFRMPVQDVYKFTESGDNRRIVAGMVETGSLSRGDEIVFYPSGKATRVNSIEEWGRPQPETVFAGKSTGFTCVTQIYTKRGELVCRSGEPAPHVGRKFRVSLFWLGQQPMTMDGAYLIKIGTSRASVKIDRILSILDASTLDKNRKTQVEQFDIADCILECDRDIAYDLTTEIPNTSRFVIVSNYEISGGGIITASEETSKKEGSGSTAPVTAAERSAYYKQKPMIFLFRGCEADMAALTAAERYLLDFGRIVYRIPSENGCTETAMLSMASALCRAGLVVLAAIGAETASAEAFLTAAKCEYEIIDVMKYEKKDDVNVNEHIFMLTERTFCV